jgi:hypothetical protein
MNIETRLVLTQPNSAERQLDSAHFRHYIQFHSIGQTHPDYGLQWVVATQDVSVPSTQSAQRDC